MLKNLSQLELTIENKICRFLCDQDTSTAIAKEALFQFIKYVGQVEDAVRAKQDEEKKASEIKEESQPNKVEDGNQQ